MLIKSCLGPVSKKEQPRSNYTRTLSFVFHSSILFSIHFMFICKREDLREKGNLLGNFHFHVVKNYPLLLSVVPMEGQLHSSIFPIQCIFCCLEWWYQADC